MQDPIVPFPVVGIGASAGGLEAFANLLSQIPADSGMAYVLVQHLDPAHESILPELLARDTAAPVALATDGVRVEEGHIYVIPPNVSMTLEDGHLRLTPRRAQDRAPLPIDEFLMSLAEVQQNNGIGVVLSGSGSDGARGIEAIKGEGGITFAQEPADARWDSMPRAAIATACVDFIQPAGDIGRRLNDIGRYRLMQNPDAAGTGDLKSIMGALRKHSGVDFSHYKDATVQRRVLRRMVLRHAESIGAYQELLQREPDELDALYQDLLIQVTRFFRDPEAFEALKREVFPKIIAAHTPGSSIRVWVPGCSTGEEAYSIAIGIMEALGDDAMGTSLQVFATDISERSIAKARAAVYPESIAADVSEERLRRFFVKEEGEAYRISKLIRDQCVFASHNLTTDPPFSQLDLISCRNVLIYLQASLHPRVFSIFHYALKPGGFLFLGSAETAAKTPDLFTPVNQAQRIYQRKDTRSFPAIPSFGRSPAQRAPSLPRKTPTELDVERHADQIVLGSHAPSGVVIDEQNHVLQFRGRTAPYLEPPTGSASFDLLKMVRPELLTDVKDALQQARTQGLRVNVKSARISGAEQAPVRIEVTPFRLNESDQQYFIVLFEESEGPAPRPGEASSSAVPVSDPDRRIAELQQRLEAYERYGRTIQQEHEATVHDLRAANEEIESSNEELQSTNEELETAKEELQSINEELTTLNDELRDRNTELGVLNDDLKNLFANVHIPVLLVDNDLRIRRFNSAADRIAHLVSTDIGRRLDEIRFRVDVPDLAEQTRFVIDSLESKERELKDESGRWYGMTIRPYRSGGHRIEGAVIVFHDINAAKQHALALQVAGHYFETIVETVRQPLLVLDESLRVVTANRAFHEDFATTPKEIRGLPLAQLGNGEWDNPALQELARRAADGDGFEGFEISVSGERARDRNLLLSAQRLDFKGTRPPLVLLAIDDVTESRKSREREHLLSEATAAMGSTLNESVLTETVAHIAVPLLADGCFLALVGRDGKLQLTDSVFHDPARAAEVQQVARISLEVSSHPVHDVVRTGEPFLAKEISDDCLRRMARDPQHLAELRRLDARSMMIVPVIASGHTRGAVVFLATSKRRSYSDADLSMATELGRRCGVALEHVELFAATAAARASAEASNRAKRDFLATMSHELRTPLNAILGYTELLELEVQGPLTSAQREAVERINYSRKHLSHLIDRVLQYARLESGSHTLNFESVPVNELLQEVAAMVEVEARRNGLSLDLRTPVLPQFVRADPGALRQIVINLVANAVKFTPRGGHVELTSSGQNGNVEVSIADDGAGIPEDKLDLIFEPFVQLKTHENGPQASMGLGLAISRDLARRMDGDITVVSAPDHGSTFTLRLPAAPADSPRSSR